MNITFLFILFVLCLITIPILLYRSVKSNSFSTLTSKFSSSISKVMTMASRLESFSDAPPDKDVKNLIDNGVQQHVNERIGHLCNLARLQAFLAAIPENSPDTVVQKEEAKLVEQILATELILQAIEQTIKTLRKVSDQESGSGARLLSSANTAVSEAKRRKSKS